MLTLLSAASSSSYLFSYQPFSEAPFLWTNAFLGRISGILKFHPVFGKSLLDGILCLQCLVDPGDLSKLKKPYTHLPILPTIRHVFFILGLFPNMNMSPKIQGLRLSTPHACWNPLCQQLYWWNPLCLMVLYIPMKSKWFPHCYSHQISMLPLFWLGPAHALAFRQVAIMATNFCSSLGYVMGFHRQKWRFDRFQSGFYMFYTL